MRVYSKPFAFLGSFLLTLALTQLLQKADALPICYMILDEESNVLVNLESICAHGPSSSSSEDDSDVSAQELFELAMERFNTSDVEDSIELLTQAIQEDSSDFHYYAARAEGYRYMQDIKAAISDYESAIEMIRRNGVVDDDPLIEYYENRLMTLGQ